MVDKIIGAGIELPEIKGGSKASGAPEKSFGEFLTESIQKVNELQQDADAAVKQIAAGSEGPALQDAMIAVEKADVAFKLMMEVRTKILDAYQEIMRMQA